MRALHWVAVTAVVLHFLVLGFAVHVSEDDARMPPGKSLGDHVCVHDKIAQDHLPTVRIKDGGHEKRFAGGFSPIRITPHFIGSLSSTFRSQLISQTGVLMKVLSLISQTLLVRPISGGFTIPPECDEYTYGANVGKCRVMHTNTRCGSYTVPRQFVGKRELCSSSSGSCYDSGPDGGGVANTDFLLFVGTQSYCYSGSTLAFASSCAMDQWHRPTAGYFTLCTSSLIQHTDAEHIPEVLFDLILHEVSHALGFSQSQFQNFHDGSLNFYRPYTSGYYSNSPITGLNSSKVLQVARNYFDCKDLPYVPLENNGGRGSASSHWEARILHHETMAPFLSNDYSVFSNFTLAFFEDSGWYQVNYTFINSYKQFQLQWGRGQGCDFVLEPCDNPNTYPYLCDTAVLHQCTFDHVSRGSCKATYTFFDGCPVVVADDDTACMYSVNTPVPNYGSEVYGDDSICVEVNTTLGDCLPRGGAPRCYQRQVVQQNGTDELAFSINVRGSTQWCRDSEVLRTNNGFLFCPSRDEILLRVTTQDISSVQSLPASENIVAVNMTSGSNISANISLLEACPVPEVQACSHGDIRLVGGLTQYEGRVEVCKNEEWGTVCDDGWGTTDAQVVCKQLGYETQGARAYLSAYFGQGVGDIHMTYVRCTGTESRLLSCSYSTPSRYSCSHYEDAGVRCPGPCLHGSVRVIDRYGSTSRQGNVELCVDGSWKTLCANSWDNKDASVVCRQIGYSPFGAVARENTGPILYPNNRFVSTELQCSGLESNITNCTQNLNESISCLSSGVASVSCHSGVLPNASCTDGAVRLRNGYLLGEGRLEICVNNAWGTVCDDGWDNADASVVCRQLGYYPVGNASRYAFFGQGRGPILLEYVQCSGFEQNLLDCDNNGLGYSTCGHYEDAGVICQANPLPVNCTLGDVRLTNGSSRLEGRVEVCFGNLWGTICHNSWDNRDAGVICKQLFNSSFGGHAINGSKFGAGDMPIVIENLNCNGTEASLINCSTISSVSNTRNSCNGATVAGIVCYEFHEGESGTCNSGAVRLADGLTKFEGRVEICYNNRWGGVCGSSWDALEAAVVCRQLGYIYFGATAFSNSYFGVGFRPRIMQVTSCLGSESSLLTCSRTPLGFDPNCNATNEVGVRCINPSNACTHGTVRLMGGTNQYQGRVEVCFHGVWGSVCDRWRSWDAVDATVVCRQLGFPSLGAVSHRYSRFGRGSGPIVIGYVSCSGRETHLLNCSYSSSASSLRYCSYSRDIGVECPVPSNNTCTTNGDLRLVGGANQYEGRVEMCYNRQWGTVCDDLWGTSDAGVACKQLGYSGVGARAFSSAFFGRGTGGIYLDNLGCHGSESRLIDCVHNTIGTHNCDHGDDAGLRCQLPGNDCTHGQIWLRNGPTNREGRVEICVDGTWGTVCDNGWSYNDARVVCRQLGFPTLGTLARSNAYYGRGSGLIMLTNIGCTGEELNLLNCTYYGYSVTSCSHSEDAGVRCPAPLTTVMNCTNGDLRLSGGTTSREGRVEMCYDRQWGTVCDDLWGTTDAKVACRQLGFSSYGATPYSNAYFGQGSGPILLDNVGCTGRETRLLDCSNYQGVGLYSLNCGHDDDAGVRCNALGNECTDGSIRLRGGTSVREGRVEICIEGRWGTICDNSWDSRDASVVCRQLGYPSLGPISRINAFYGRGSGPIWLDYLTCTGNETDLLKCSHNGIGVTSYYCGHDDDVGVQCPASQIVKCTTGAVKLVGGATKHQGRVEICYNNQWGTVCDDLWSNIDARVVCRQLGHTPIGAVAYSNAYFGRGRGGIFLDNVGCSGTESSLLICSNSGIGIHNCDHSADAGVKCLDRTNCKEGEIRLRGGLREGTVELCLSGIWGTICDNSWDSRDASVVCRQLGFPVLGAIPISNAYFGRGTGAILIDYVSCMGSEQFLANCTNNGIGITSSFCNHNQDAGVQCPAPVNATVPCTNGAVRLVGGLRSNQGRVEICYNNQWGTVCDNLFSSIDARVVCRQLGFSAIGATTYSNAFFGRGSGGIFLDNVGCTGAESSLFHCVHRGIGVHSCRHSDDVGIKCAVPVNCSDGQIRLRGGLTQREGRVEICISRVWGTICDNSWDNYEAQVVCRQLGHSVLGAKSFSNARFGRGTGPLLLDRLRCSGTEQNLLNCSHSGEGVTASYCSHYDDAGVRCLAPFVPDNCTEGSVRLLFGSTTRSGTVQVCVNHTWGSICDSNWDSQDADVVCRQLGFTTIGPIPRLNSFYGRASGPMWLDYVRCTGSESNILNCSHNGIGSVSSFCDSGDHSGVECPVPVTANCTDGALRLVGGLTEREGRVEVCYKNQWGTVCDDSWGSADAGVACKQLGFPYYGATAYSLAYFGRGTGGIFLDNLYCRGRESRLFDCSHSGVGVHNCDHSADAGLRCQAPNCFVEGEIRLRGGTAPREGRVEICLGGVWGTVCDNGWGTTDARVVCRQLGYPTIGALPISRAFFGRGSGPILMSYVGCSGLESHLANCTRSTAYCSHSEDAGVRCPNRTTTNANCTDGQLRLRGGTISREGRVEMCYERQWGTVCDNSWGTSDAKVACRQLGFSSHGAISYSNAHFGQGSGPILLDNVGCTGRESRLLECSNYGGVGLHSSFCGHDDDAGVRCNARSNECSDGSIRLRGSPAAGQGRVEICAEGTWGTVCDNSWDSRDAAVVCRQLGYPSLGAIPYSNARFGSGSGPIWLDYLYCNGNEHRLLNCSHRGIGGTSPFCSHRDDVGVQCPAPVTTPVCCTDGDIRLVNGSVANEGRVEICYNNQWGTICDDSFGSFEAAVVCRQLGYSAIGAVGYSFSRFGGGSGGIFLDNLGCYGYESRLLDCTRPTIGVHDCDHSADAGVRCQGSTSVTREERICTAAATQPSPTPTQPSTQPTTQLITKAATQPTKLVTTVKPTLTKAATNTLIQTMITPQPQPTNLPTSSPQSCPTFGVRLVNGTSMYEGRVEMCFNNTWGTICGKDWDAQDAAVVCKQLGFSSTDAVALRGAYFGEGRGPILMEGVYCEGDEKGLHRCFQTHSQPCSHIEDAAVKCSGPSGIPKVIRFVNVTTDLMNKAVVTVVLQSNQLLGQGNHSIETVVTIKSYISSQCSQTDECKCINSSLMDKKRLTRAADIDVHVVNFTTTENGKISISLYATLSSEALSADSLEAVLKEASTMNATLTQSGVSVVGVYRPSGFITTSDQSSGSPGSPLVIVGVLLGAVGGVMLIGALGCMIIAGLIYNKKVKRGGEYEAITDHSTHAVVHTTQRTQLNAKIGATE